MKKTSHTFHINYLSEVEEQRYEGVFTVRKLNVRDVGSLGVRKAQLNGGLHYDEDKPGYGVDAQTDNFNGVIAHLEIAVTSAPKWWKLDEIYDVALIYKVYKEVTSFENSFRRSAGSQSDDKSSSQDGSVTPEKGTIGPGTPAEMVVYEVQASLEP